MSMFNGAFERTSGKATHFPLHLKLGGWSYELAKLSYNRTNLEYTAKKWT